MQQTRRHHRSPSLALQRIRSQRNLQVFKGAYLPAITVPGWHHFHAPEPAEFQGSGAIHKEGLFILHAPPGKLDREDGRRSPLFPKLDGPFPSGDKNDDDPRLPASTSPHIIRTLKGAGLYVGGQVETAPVDWIVDTGCTVTLVSRSVFDKLHPDDRPELFLHSRELVSADGSPLKTLGEAQFNISVGSKTVVHRAVIADIQNDGLLGIDFLKQHEFMIDFTTNRLHCKEDSIQAHCKLEKTDRACRVSVADHTVIPAGTRTIITAKSSRPLAHGSWLVEPLSRPPGNQPVLSAKVVVQGNGTLVPVEIINPTHHDVTLFRHTSIGIASRLFQSNMVGRISTEITNLDERVVLPSTDDRLPPDLESMVDSIDSDLSDDQKATIRQLLNENQSVFASKDVPFGHTDLITHSINTKTERPIKQPVRRPPFHLREEAHREVSKMLEQDVIEPSDSPWASPVVLVRKKDGSLRYCIDYRKLNDVTIKDSYPLPRIDESLDSLSHTKYFSTLDLASGYWQIGLDDDA